MSKLQIDVVKEKKTLKLFEDDEIDGQDGDDSKIEINEEYARRLEYNRKRQDLQRYEELKKKGLIDDEDSDESDESEESESEEDSEDSMRNLKFFEALNKVKKQDPSLKNKDVKLFDSDESESEEVEGGEREDENRNKKDVKDKKKKMYLKDVQAKHLVEEGPEFGDEDEEDKKQNKKHIKTYNEEQEELRKKFLNAVEAAEDDEDEGDILTLKEDRKVGLEEDGENKEFVKKLDEYFGGDVELDENKKFLKEFFMKRMWMDRDDKGKRALVDENELDDLEKDEEEIERQEDYETNYRYEENAGDRVMGHSRKVEGSVRKQENARKEQRKSKDERMKIAEMERQEELKYLKNLKKKEIKERMKKVLSIAGFKDVEECPFSAKDLEDEFDPEEYDRMMKTVFDENYYDGEDSGFSSDEDGDEKPDFEKEDELLGLPKNWDVIKPGEGFLATRGKSLKEKMGDVSDDGVEGGGENNNSDGDEHESGEEEAKEDERLNEGTEESKRKRKRKASLVQRAKEALMEEYYKLDYEDTIGDLKTRFKYAKVKPNRFGLSSEELLGVDEKELNQYVSLKKIAPYRENEWKVPGSKRYEQKIKNKVLLRNKVDHNKKKKNKKRSRVDDEKPSSEKRVLDDQKIGKKEIKGKNADKKSENEVEMGNLSRSAKRRRRQSEFKLPRSRLVAYGKI